MGKLNEKEPKPWTKKTWGAYEHIDEVVPIEDIRSAYLWFVKEIEKGQDTALHTIGARCGIDYDHSFWGEEIKALLKKAFQAVSEEEKKP